MLKKKAFAGIPRLSDVCAVAPLLTAVPFSSTRRWDGLPFEPRVSAEPRLFGK